MRVATAGAGAVRTRTLSPRRPASAPDWTQPGRSAPCGRGPVTPALLAPLWRERGSPSVGEGGCSAARSGGGEGRARPAPRAPGMVSGARGPAGGWAGGAEAAGGGRGEPGRGSRERPAAAGRLLAPRGPSPRAPCHLARSARAPAAVASVPRGAARDRSLAPLLNGTQRAVLTADPDTSGRRSAVRAPAGPGVPKGRLAGGNRFPPSLFRAP